jgi:hypothetical protein
LPHRSKGSSYRQFVEGILKKTLVTIPHGYSTKYVSYVRQCPNPFQSHPETAYSAQGRNKFPDQVAHQTRIFLTIWTYIITELLGFRTLSIVRILIITRKRIIIIKIRTMDKVRKPSNSVCYTPSSEPYRIYILLRCMLQFVYADLIKTSFNILMK